VIGPGSRALRRLALVGTRPGRLDPGPSFGAPPEKLIELERGAGPVIARGGQRRTTRARGPGSIFP